MNDRHNISKLFTLGSKGLIETTISPNEATDLAENKKTDVITHKRTVADLDTFTPQEIQAIRVRAGMTQKTFAACLGVSVNSVAAWEGGRRRPDGPARRILGLMKINPHFAEEVGILVSS